MMGVGLCRAFLLGYGCLHLRFASAASSSRRRSVILSSFVRAQPPAFQALSAPAKPRRRRRLSSPPTTSGLCAASSRASSDTCPPRPGSIEAARRETGQVPYGEGSRQYRRTVFRTHADWRKHRSPDRLKRDLLNAVVSGVARQLAHGVMAVTLVATAVVLWNGTVGTAAFERTVLAPLGLAARPGVADLLKLRVPAQPFSFSAPALGLLLVFRNNASYQRWLEGHNSITRVLAQLKSILRMAATTTWSSANTAPGAPEPRVQLKELASACWAVMRSLQNHLRDPNVEEEGFATHLRSTLLDPDKAERILASMDRPYWAIHDLSAAIEKLTIDVWHKKEMNKCVTAITESIETCTKILRYPIPLVYTRHLGRFLSCWLLLLPLGMYDMFASSWKHCLLIPTSAIISFFFLGIDEFGVQLEEPFSILPLEYSCAMVKKQAKQAIQWYDADVAASAESGNLLHTETVSNNHQLAQENDAPLHEARTNV